MSLDTEKRLEFLAREVRYDAIPRFALEEVAISVGSIDVFEAVASGAIDSAAGAEILMLRRGRERRPWWTRALLWLVMKGTT